MSTVSTDSHSTATLAADGYLADAVAQARAEIAAGADDAGRYAELARIAVVAGDYAAADKAVQWLVKHRGEENDHVLRVLLLALTRKFKAFDKAMPEAPLAWQRMIQELANLGEHELADRLARQARRRWPDEAGLAFDHAVVMAARGQGGDALDVFQQVLTAAPNNPAALFNVARTQFSLGHREDAVATTLALLDRAPDHVEAIRLLAALDAPELADPAMRDRLTVLAASPALADVQRAHVHFAVARGFDRADALADAVRHYRDAGALKNKTDPFDIEADFRLMQTMARAGRSLSGTAAKSGGDVTLLLIAGMPRSGTTLVEQILARHSRVETAGETSVVRDGLLAGFGGQTGQWTPFGREFAHGLETGAPEHRAQLWKRIVRDYRGRGLQSRFLVEKAPRNLIYAPLLLAAFPAAKVILTDRDLRDTCVSCMTMDFDAAYGFCNDLGGLGRYAVQARALGAWLQSAFPDRVFTVDYARLVHSPDEEIPRLVAFAGLEMEDACLSPEQGDGAVVTASAAQVRKPINASAVGRWRRYEAHVQDLLTALEAPAQLDFD